MSLILTPSSTGEVTSLDRALRVDLPTGDGIIDVTSGGVDAIGQLPTG